MPGVAVFGVIAGHGRVTMPPSISALRSRWAATDAGGLKSVWWRIAPIVALHLAALWVLQQTEYYEFVYIVGFLLFWAFLNCFWLAQFRRPGMNGY